MTAPTALGGTGGDTTAPTVSGGTRRYNNAVVMPGTVTFVTATAADTSAWPACSSRWTA